MRDLPLGYRYVGNDPPPINMENVYIEIILCCGRKRIVPHNKFLCRRRRIISSDNPAPDTVYCWVTEDISRTMNLNFFIHPIPSRIGLGVIKLQEEKREMEGWIRYNVVSMLFHWKLDKMKTHQKSTARQASVNIVCYENAIRRPKVFYRVKNWWKTYNSSIASVFIGPLGKENIPGCFVITNKSEEYFPGYLQELYWHAVRVHTDEASFQEITEAMVEKLIEYG